MAHPQNVQTLIRGRDVSALVEEYAAVWRRTLDSVTFPQPDSYLEFVDEDSQPELRALLESVDDQYRRMLVEAESEATSPNWGDATIIGPPPEAPEIAAAPADGNGHHAPTLITPPGAEPSFAATAEFSDVGPAGATPVKSAHRAQPATDGGRHAATVIGKVDAGADVEVSWDLKSAPQSKKASARPTKLPTVPGYEILGVLGRGGMGVVYRARQTGLNRVVALKMILAGDHAAPEHVARFKTEAEAVAQLQHPNIVQIFDINSVDGLPYFSLEFVDGRSLEEVRDGKPMAADKAARMLVTLARAMHYAHQRGIVHRDLKPANVLLTSGGVPKVTDFGLVKRVEADSSETRTGTIVGTPSYMAPEQAWGKTDIGPAADVYALGAMLYTLLTGRPPFLGTTPLETIMQLRQQEPVPPSRLQPNLPRDVETICMKALQKSPEARYESADAFADDLERFLEGAPILARPVGRAERVWRWCRRNPALAASGGAALALAVCLMVGGPVAAAMIYDQKEQAVTARNQADENAQKADANARTAEANARQADENAALARASADIARNQRELSITALNTLAERVQRDLRRIAGTQDLRKTLLRMAMDGLNKVADLAGAQQSRDLVMGRAHRQMGDVLLEEGLSTEALSQFKKSHDTVLQLEADPAKPHVPHLNLGRSYVNLGRAARQLGDAPGARDYFLQSLKSRQDALSLAPDKLFVKQEIADAYGHLGNVSLELGQPDAALEYFRQSMELRREWMLAAPENVSAVREYSGAQLSLAGAAVDQGRLTEAIEQYGSALETLARVAAADGSSIDARGNIAFAHGQRGMASLFADDAQQARTEYERAAETFSRLVEEDPQRADLQLKLGSAYYGLGTASREVGDADASRQHFARCVEVRRRLVEKEPSDRIYQAGLMLALARAGEHAEAVGIAEQIEQHSPEDASLQYIVAGGYALAKAAAADDTELAGQYANRAIGALENAVKHGYRGVALMRMDPDLDPIREMPEFQKVVGGLEQALARPPADQTASAADSAGAEVDR